VHADNLAYSVAQPNRNAGFTLGDVLEQSIDLSGEGRFTNLMDLPALQREGLWVERIATVISRNSTRLTIQYQIVNASTEVVVASLPSLELKFQHEQSLHLSEWTFSISPQLPFHSTAVDDMPAMMDDTIIKPTSNLSLAKKIRWLAVCLLATVLAWVVWIVWLNRSDRTNLPFARAYKLIKKANMTKAEEKTGAWLALHKAFDEIAGQTVSSGSVDNCLNDNVWLKPLQIPIKTFYSASTQHFFNPKTVDQKIDLIDLSKKLYRAEKIHRSAIRPVLSKRNSH
jgi:mxaA protein